MLGSIHRSNMDSLFTEKKTAGGVVGCRERDFQIPRTRFSPSINFQWKPTILNFYTARPLFWTDRQVIANGSIVECRTDLNSIDLMFPLLSSLFSKTGQNWGLYLLASILLLLFCYNLFRYRKRVPSHKLKFCRKGCHFKPSPPKQAKTRN